MDRTFHRLDDMTADPAPRRFRFSLRTLFVVVTVAAMLAGLFMWSALGIAVAALWVGVGLMIVDLIGVILRLTKAKRSHGDESRPTARH